MDSKRKLPAKKLCYAKPTRSSWPLKQGHMGDLSQLKEDLEQKITTWQREVLAHANCTPLLEEKDLKNDRLKNHFFWTFATHMTQIPPKKYNFTQFAAFFHFLFFKINYYFV